MESNYEKQVYIARELFLKFDQKEILRKFQLEHDEKYLYVNLLDQKCCISRADGIVYYREETGMRECLDFSVVMTIYDVLCHSKTLPVLDHKWCPLHDLQVTMSSPNDGIFTRKYAQMFSGKTDQLREICRRIGGEQPAVRAGADVCWQFSLFPFFPVQLRFWDGDKEFEPKFQFLWDKKSLDFMHFETTYYAMGLLMERLCVYLRQQTGGE